MSASLRDLADAAGIDVSYTSWRNEPVSASDESIFAALCALAPDLGIQLSNEDDAAHALSVLTRERWREIVPPVVIGWDGSLTIPFAVPAETDHDYEVEVVTETGRTVHARGRLFDLPADSHAWPGGVVHCLRRATVYLDGENGYHSVRWRTAGAQGEAFAISAPMRAWGAPGAMKRWGVFAPVYGLASPATGQAGDLSSLRRLFAAVGARGGAYVATLPILAAFLDEPCQFSPYSPASRLAWNELYLDLADLAQRAVAYGATLPSSIQAAIATPPKIVPDTLIDFRAQYQWRRAVIDPLAAALFARPAFQTELASFAGPTIYDYAAFRAVGETQRTGWKHWPAPWRDDTPPIESHAHAVSLGADGARVTTHAVAQWAMQRQLEALDALDQNRVGLYLDLPVGVNGDAYEVWRRRALFVTDLAAGAPPDALFLGGQDWGLPPLSPIALRRDRYRYFIRCVQHHMRVSRMLRIDHVMGLFRLYCIPRGRPATDGVYLRYHAGELLAILALESTRNHCALVGEDLGTVPAHVRPAMERHGLFRLHVGQWCFPTKVGDSPQASPPNCIASLNTHDTATFAGWWRGADIDDRRDLGLITAEQEATERVERATQRDALLAFAGAEPAADSLTEVERAMVAATTDLALGPAEVVLVALDDLALDPIPHNVPGTTTERPNWQRRIERWADALDPRTASSAAAATINAVVTARPPRK